MPSVRDELIAAWKTWATLVNQEPNKVTLYEVFGASEARRIVNKLELRYTPKHGNWLNMAECEFEILLNQCLDQRIAERATVQRKCDAWEQGRN